MFFPSSLVHVSLHRVRPCTQKVLSKYFLDEQVFSHLDCRLLLLLRREGSKVVAKRDY